MSARTIIHEAYLHEIALASEFDRELLTTEPSNPHDEIDPKITSAVEADFQQAKEWYALANQNGITPSDLARTSKKYNFPSYSAAIDAAYAGAGQAFPVRGSWSGELVLLYLTLKDGGLL